MTGTVNSPRPRTRPWYRRTAPLACAAAGFALAGTLALGIPLATSAAVYAAASELTHSPAATGGTTEVLEPSRQGATGRQSTSQRVTQTPATAASASESTGVVLIDTALGYQDAAAAGTGMVLTSDGLVLTNNHVIEGSTEIRVTDPSNGLTYAATVVGTDVKDDVALLQLKDAADLPTVTIDNDNEAVGDAVTAVGNASGGGTLMAADGAITALQSSVTTQAEGTVAGETLHGMIQVSADVVPGDSGGALLDAQGEVVGMTTAASSGTAVTTAYAIPIEKALAIVDQIRAGDETDGVALGYPAFLGVSAAPGVSALPSTTTGALIGGVVDATPAATAGLEAGDTITAVDGRAVTGWTGLSQALAAHKPGDTVTLSWTDQQGVPATATVTLAAGPAA
ncbi:S1C family serine protease [Microbacterium sp. SORGH_AS_0888]|uniref:S1C family serine protease n=1 Tax=Microbacterium sp. SORGH_AS_0888 TaxID=3041791 RepID=UPI0027826CF6|nr:S1-C subfamily serine protease [Microbacterium sp. SORGH_AS_0888]